MVFKNITLLLSIFVLINYSQQQEYFSCDFDGTTAIATICGGTTVTPAFLAPVALSSTNLDIFNGVTITDVTSILSPTLNTGKCNIPYQYNNTMNYFCSKPAAANRFICEINEPGSGEFDDCKVLSGVQLVSRYLKVKQTAGNAYTSSIEFRSAINIPEPGKYRLSMYSYYNFPKDAGEHMVISIKNGNSGTFIEVYKNGTDFDRFQDIEWIYEELEIDCTDTPIFIKIEFSRLNKDVIGMIAIDNLRVDKLPSTGGPIDETTTTTEKPIEETSTTTEKPIDETTTTTQKPIDETSTSTDGPIDETTSTTQKPIDETTSTTQKPIDETTSTTQKPIDETTSTTQKPIPTSTTIQTTTIGPTIKPVTSTTEEVTENSSTTRVTLNTQCNSYNEQKDDDTFWKYASIVGTILLLVLISSFIAYLFYKRRSSYKNNQEFDEAKNRNRSNKNNSRNKVLEMDIYEQTNRNKENVYDKMELKQME